MTFVRACVCRGNPRQKSGKGRSSPFRNGRHTQLHLGGTVNGNRSYGWPSAVFLDKNLVKKLKAFA